MNTYRNQMVFRSILHLSMGWIWEKYLLWLISWSTWSLALVSNFNTPSQLGTTPSVDPYVQLYYLCHQCLALLCSTLLSSSLLCLALLSSALLSFVEPWRRRIDWECLIPFSTGPKSISSEESVSYHSYWPKLVLLIPDQYQKGVSQTTHTNRKSVGGHPSIGSMVDTMMYPSIVLLWSVTPFPCSLIRWEVLPMSPRLHGYDASTGERIILSNSRHKTTNHPGPQEN